MKIIYTTDLHGDKDKYCKLEEVALNFGAETVINGGDTLPHGGFDVQRNFINIELQEHFAHFEKMDIKYLVQPGNDDYKCFDPLLNDVCDKFSLVYNTAQNKVEIDNFDFIGMNWVRDYPFRLKDRCKLDGLDFNEILPLQYGNALLSTITDEEGYTELEDWEEYIRGQRTIYDELLFLPHPRPDCKLVYIFHQPPANMGLDICYDGREVGSDAVSEFLTCRDASYSLHGHIHESPTMSGKWKHRLGTTECVQPGQLTGLTYVTIDTESGEIDRRITTR